MRKKGFGSKFDTPVLFSTVLIFAALVFSNGCGGGFDESKSSLADELACAEVSEAVAQALALSKLMAGPTSNRRARGIAAGDAFGRLVAITLAR